MVVVWHVPSPLHGRYPLADIGAAKILPHGVCDRQEMSAANRMPPHATMTVTSSRLSENDEVRGRQHGRGVIYPRHARSSAGPVVPHAGHHPSRRGQVQELRHRWPHHEAPRLHDQPTHPQTHRTDHGLGEGPRRPTQDPTPRRSQQRLPLHHHRRCLQPLEDLPPRAGPGIAEIVTHAPSPPPLGGEAATCRGRKPRLTQDHGPSTSFSDSLLDHVAFEYVNWS